MSKIYNIVKSVITDKNYELSGMLHKIDVFWVRGDISEDEKTELVALARGNVIPEHSFKGLEERVSDILKRLEVVERKLNSGSDSDVPDTETEEYPPYKAPTGAHDAYYNGDKMTFTDGIKYICIAPVGSACVWGPDVMPDWWEAVDAPLTV